MQINSFSRWCRNVARRFSPATRATGLFSRPAKGRRARSARRWLGNGFEVLEDRQLLAITATISYEYDTLNFFNTQAKKDLLQSATNELVSRLQDDLQAITPGGGDTWSAVFFHPGTGSNTSRPNLVVPQDELIIYAGGRELGSTLGQGGPGGFTASGSTGWLNTVETRGEPNAKGTGATDFGPWGGSITFDTTTNWFFGATTVGLDPGEMDFYSVALHEMAHMLGFGASSAWETRVISATNEFTGPASVGEYDLGGNVPLSGAESHWASGTQDQGQETAMDPSLNSGTRKLLTNLDLAGLADVGWDIDLSAPPVTEAKLSASEAQLADWYGYSVDIDGDYAVIGSKLDDDDGSGSGSAYVYHLVGGTWEQQAKLTASDALAGDQFGHSVAISGDTVVVGSWLADSTGINAGAAYIFQRDQGGTNNWGEVKQIWGSGTTGSDKFGWSVDIDADTVVVGAAEDDPRGNASGAAFVFLRNQGGANNWGEVAALTASDGSAIDKFGSDVAVDGDTIVVGAYLSNTSGTYSGAGYVFSRNVGGADNWGEVKKLAPGDLAVNDQFGYSVTVDGGRIVVSSWLDDFNLGPFKSNAGSVYVFEQNNGGTNNWGQVTKSFAEDPGPGDRLGSAVSLVGDRLLAGAMFDDNTFTDDGSAYVFERNVGGTDNWGQAQKLTAGDPHTNDNFGISAALRNDAALIGAYVGDAAGVLNSGVAYVYGLGTVGPAALGGLQAGSSDADSPPQQANNEPGETIPFLATRQKDSLGGCACGGLGCAACSGTSDVEISASTIDFDDDARLDPLDEI